jgi:hypothetical protein
MHYAILCYDSEAAFDTWTKEQEDREMASLGAVQARLAKAGKLGPVARLMPTTAAATVRKSRAPVVIDGPFAETKEQLLGFYVVRCESLEEALEAARELARASSTSGCYEVRPLAIFVPGAGAS